MPERSLIRLLRPVIRVQRSICRWLRDQTAPLGRLNTNSGVESALGGRSASLLEAAIHELKPIAAVSKSRGGGADASCALDAQIVTFKTALGVDSAVLPNIL